MVVSGPLAGNFLARRQRVDTGKFFRIPTTSGFRGAKRIIFAGFSGNNSEMSRSF
jgi:hypothetical protein